MTQTNSSKTNFSCDSASQSFSVLPGDIVTVRLVVSDSNQRTVHVCESSCKVLTSGCIRNIGVDVSYRFLEVNRSISHFSRDNAKGSKVGL